MKCLKCLAEAPDGAEKCPKCGAVLPLPVRDGPLRSVIRFSYIMPLYSKPLIRYDEEGQLVNIETEFRLYVAAREAKQPPIIVFDKDGYVSTKRLEYALTRLSNEDLVNFANAVPERIFRKVLQAHNLQPRKGEHPLQLLYEHGLIVTPVPRLKSVDFLKSFDWRGLVEDIVNYKRVDIDERLKIVRKAHLPRGIRQAINPHALIVLPGQTGKSEWYKYVGVCDDKVTPNSLIGYADSEGPKPGSVDGCDVAYALDQIEMSGASLIFRYMLGLMEFGEARVDTAAYPFTIRSLSPFAILSNPIGDPKSNFAVLIEKLSKNPSLGRRFGIILYDKEAKRIRQREKSMEELLEKVSLFRAVEEYAWTEVQRIVRNDKVWEWLNARNEEWVKQALKIIEPIEPEGENLYLFLREFIENGWSHIRGGALRAALAMNMDLIALKSYSIDDLLCEAEEYLAEILEMNFESIKRLAATYQETKEEAALRTFDMLPSYLKEIVSAVELWRRSLRDEDKVAIKVPFSFYLSTLDYKPQTANYFSQILLIARRANPEKYNEDLKKHFQLEIKKEGKDLAVLVYSLDPMPFLKVVGVLDNLDILDNLANFGRPIFLQKQQAETFRDESPSQNIGLLNDAKMSKLSKMSKNEEDEISSLPAKPFAVLERVTPIRWLPCPFCGREGLEYHVKFVDGEEVFVCAQCARRLKEKWMGEGGS